MARRYEKEFREKYPNARFETEPSGICGMPRFVVYVGDYRCAESLNRSTAFRSALVQAECGNITPDPFEISEL